MNYNNKCEKDCQPDYGKMFEKETDKCGGCERHPIVCCTPKIDCVDVEVKVFADHRKECDPCKKEEVVFCYKIINNGPGCATNVVLKSFFCPEPRKICVVTKEEHANFTYKNGIFTFCVDKIRPCECVDVEVTIKEQCEVRCPDKFFDKRDGECCEKKERHQKEFETTAFVEAKEEDLCICNNVDFASSCHPMPQRA